MTEGVTLKEYLKKEGFKDISKYNIWVNGEKKNLDYILKEDDEVIVLPILKGGSVQIKTLDDYGFLLSLIGGVLTVVMAVLGFIVSVVDKDIHWFLGSGYIGLANAIAGTVISIIFGVLAILIGLKLFVPKIRDIIEKIDLIIISIILFAIGIVAFGIGGIIIIVGGILVLIYRLQKQ